MSNNQTSIHVSVPAPTVPVDREALLRDLPAILNWVLLLIQQEVDIDADPTCRLAVASRLLAATIDRLGK